ncbi:MAG: DUF177 domain-containing protein [Pseudomonadota bacterium]
MADKDTGAPAGDDWGFERLAPIEALADGEWRLEFTASEAERRALADRLGLVRLDAFSGSARLVGAPGAAVLSGAWRATLTQSCVVSLEDVDASLSGDLSIAFAADADPEAAEPSGDIEVDLESDPPEPMPEDAIDVGAFFAEDLALSINPYPRRPDAAASANPVGDAGEPGPFAALAKLRGEGAAAE